MPLCSKKVAMIMLMGLLVAGLVGQIPHSIAAETGFEKAEALLKQAAAMHAKAQQQLKAMMAKMDSMKNMQMTTNEKEMMDAMHEMAMTMKMLLDENKMLMDALKDILQMAKEKRG